MYETSWPPWSLPSRVLPWCRRGRRTLRRILVLIIPLNCPKNLAKKALFLLIVLGTLGRLGRLYDRWGRKWLGCLLSRIRHRRRRTRMWSNAKDLLEEIALITSGHLAGLIRLSARDKGRFVIVRTDGSGQVIRYFVELYVDHSGRRIEGTNSILVLWQGDRAFHELSPDRRCGFGAFQLQVTVVVITYPNNAQQIRGVAGEPGVVRGPRLSCRGSREAVTAPNSGCSAVIQNTFHHGRRDVGHAGVEYLAAVGSEVLQDIAFGIPHRTDEDR